MLINIYKNHTQRKNFTMQTRSIDENRSCNFKILCYNICIDHLNKIGLVVLALPNRVEALGAPCGDPVMIYTI